MITRRDVEALKNTYDSSEHDGMTISITGNSPRAEAHADWIAALLTYGPGLIERCLWLESTVNDLERQLRERGSA